MRGIKIGDIVRTNAIFEGEYHRDISCTVLDVIGQSLKLRYNGLEFYRPIDDCTHDEQESAVEYLFRKYMDRGQKLYLSDFIEASNIEQNYFDNKQNPLQ